MTEKYMFGRPFETDAVVVDVPEAQGALPYGSVSVTDGFCFTYRMGEDDIVYGLGEANRGINKRGFCYVSDCTDEPNHLEDLRSLYGAHNFLVVAGRETFGLFFDYPAAMTFDVGFTRTELLQVTCRRADLALFVLTGESPYDIVRQFRALIGRSYLAPKFAFGFGQSRWGYAAQEEVRGVAEQHRRHHVPLDMIYLDIDYMQDYKDFTISEKGFPDFSALVEEMKQQHVHLVPIIDAGVKVEKGYDVYEEGVENGYFCVRGDGSPFVGVVWPGETHFPDVLNPDARAWFGRNYRRLTEQGIEGFWNDMNEPAIFYTPEGIADAKEELSRFLAREIRGESLWGLKDRLAGLANRPEDYRSFFHRVNGQMVCHEDVHNLYGCYMTRAASEALEEIAPGKRFLLFSRSSYIGMHRYAGIWTGDNKSWWSHLLLNLKMLPSLNMCGFLYVGADLGGFGADTSRDLLLRWLALGVFTPLMRNHSAVGTREQEFYRFERVEDFRHVIGVRYRLLPYLYSEYMKAALGNDLYFKPLAFVYPEDEIAVHTEDQLMLGDEIMIAPVYTQNAIGRTVYLPEDMLFVKFLPDGEISRERLAPGLHFVRVAVNEVPLFIRSGRCIPLADIAESVDEIDTGSLQVLGFEGAEYLLYEDDGESTDCRLEGHCRIVR